MLPIPAHYMEFNCLVLFTIRIYFYYYIIKNIALSEYDHVAIFMPIFGKTVNIEAHFTQANLNVSNQSFTPAVHYGMGKWSHWSVIFWETCYVSGQTSR